MRRTFSGCGGCDGHGSGSLVWVSRARLGLSAQTRPKAAAATSGTTPQIRTRVGDTGRLVPDPSPTADFVGRNDELAAFERAVAAAREGAPAVLLIGGEAGIGKSTLVTEGARRAGRGADRRPMRADGRRGDPAGALGRPAPQRAANQPRGARGRADARAAARLGRAGPGGPRTGGGRTVRAAARARRGPRRRRRDRRRVRGSALGRPLDLGPVRFPRPQSRRRTRRPGRHLPRQRGRA